MAATPDRGGLGRAARMRYQRQILLPEWGLEGQRRVLASRVVVVGAGALGSPAALYLAAAGVGRLDIVDADRIEEHNLHRQVLYATAEVGEAKAAAAARRLLALNPGIEVTAHQVFLSAANAADLVRGADLVVNGSDNFPTRYLVNDACVLAGIPLVDAAILRFEGQLGVFVPGGGCYRCLFPEPPPPGTVPDCAQAGVLGALAGVLGSSQAIEALKLLAALGDGRGRFAVYDALTGAWQSMRLRRDAACAVCGDRPSVTTLLGDYAGFCGLAPDSGPGEGDAALEPVAAFALWRSGKATLVDVRRPDEFAAGHVTQSLSVPLDTLSDSAALLPEGTLLLLCQSGVRSAQATALLRRQGREAYSVRGGLLAWEDEGLALSR